MNEVFCGDCLDELRKLDSSSVQLIITSPPYADSRKKTYGGIPPDLYVEWFLPRCLEFKRVLKTTGTFILNIKEKVVKCERHTYVLELILALRKQGWLWTEELIWHKKTAMPGKWPNRFRDAWERLLQFNLSPKFFMDQESVKIPIGDWASSRLKKLGSGDSERHNSDTKSGFGRNMKNWVGKDTVLPTNVLHMAAECSNKKHSAVFPYQLPEWFIKVFSCKDDVVLDPFAGSGTTLLAARNLDRQYVGVELLDENIRLIHERLGITKSLSEVT